MNSPGLEAASWAFQQDYLTFLAVLGWLTAGLMAWGETAERRLDPHAPWKAFAFFCFFSALDGTFDLAKMIAPAIWPRELDASLRLLAYAYLLEFSRRSLAGSRRRPLPAWLTPLLPLAAQVVLILAPQSSPGPELVVAAVAGLAALVAIVAAVGPGTRLLLIVAGVLPFLAPRELLRGTSRPQLDGLFGLFVSGEAASAAFTAAVLAWFAAVGFWLRTLQRRRQGMFAGRPEAFSPVTAVVLPAALVATLGTGYFLVNQSAQRERTRIESDYGERARTAALAVNGEDLPELVVAGRVPASLQVSRRVLNQIRAMQAISDDVVRAYVWTVVDGSVQLPGGWIAGESGPGREPPIKGVGVAALPAPGRARVLPPVASPNGAVLIATAPILDPARHVHRAWLGLDFSAREWLLGQALARLQTISQVGLFAILIIFFLAYLILHEDEGELLIGKERAEAADRAKDEFLAVMSHELRTPMHSVLGYGELLSRTPLNPTQQSYLETVRGQGRTLLRIVQDILDFSTLRKTSYTLKHEEVHLHRVIATAFDGLRPLAARKQLRFECTIANDVPEVVPGDGVRIEQVLLNLLNNAVKFTDRGAVQLDVTTERIEPGPGRARHWVLFSIADTGLGIRPEDRDKLFQPFTRLSTGDQIPREGTGLGLAIVRRVCELMGGSVQLESEWGKGTRFHVRLPFTIDPALAALPAAGSGTPRTGAPGTDETVNLGAVLPLAVLVADDNPFIRRLLVEYLHAIGYEPVAVQTGTEAVERWREFDLLIMDLRMPGLDGLTAAERIRAAAGSDTEPWIIGISASLAEAEIERALKAGMNDFLGKPFFVPSLVEAIKASPLYERRTGEPVRAAAGGPDGTAPQVAPAAAAAGVPAAGGEPSGVMSWMPDLSGAESSEIVRQALAEIPTVLDEISQALARDDLETTADRAHYLKNTVFALRIEPMVAPCRSVFERARAGDTASARQSLETLQAAFAAWEESRRPA